MNKRYLHAIHLDTYSKYSYLYSWEETKIYSPILFLVAENSWQARINQYEYRYIKRKYNVSGNKILM